MRNMPARNARRDTNEQDIVEALVAAGASVARIGRDGVPDLLVGYLGETYLLEVKREAGPRGGTKGKKLNAKQQTFWQGWKGRAPVLVRTVEEALKAIGVGVVTQQDVVNSISLLHERAGLPAHLVMPTLPRTAAAEQARIDAWFDGQCCDKDLGGSHYHCGKCGAVSSMQGCGDGNHADGT
jgi:Holliday junction resolvase